MVAETISSSKKTACPRPTLQSCLILFAREVEICELAVELGGLFVIGPCRFDLGGKGSDMNGFVASVYASGPIFFVPVLADALEPGGAISRRLIATVLGVCA